MHNSVQRQCFPTLTAFVGVLISAVWLLTVVTPGEEAVKVRNAFLAEMGTPEDFTWDPEFVPESYLINRSEPPGSFQEIARRVSFAASSGETASFEHALSIARDLMRAPNRQGGAIQSDNLETYKAITEHGLGYCADFTQVFNGMAVASGIPVREWSISFGGFGAGHAFNEIFDRSLDKWILLDSFHSLYFVDPASRELLSVREVHDRLLSIGSEARGVAIERIVPGRFPFRSDALAIDYYRRGMPQLAMLWGNNVFDYEKSRLVQAASHVSRSAEQAVAMTLGTYPKIKIYPQGVSERDLAELFRARERLLLAAASLVLSTALFAIQLLALLRSRRDRLSGASVTHDA